MTPLQILTPSDQLIQHLEGQIRLGVLTGTLPGSKALSKELGVNHKTMDFALKVLESKGLVQSHGTGKRRSIVPQAKASLKKLRVGILLYEADDAKHHYMIDIRDKLIQLGHQAVFASKTLSDMRMDLSRIERLTKDNKSDAWIVQSANREILEWFSQKPFRAFGLFGRFRNVPIAASGIVKEPAVEDAVRQLYSLGHRRIVMLVQHEQVFPHPAPIPRAFLEALNSLGIESGRYNLPQWGKGPEGFRQCLDSLFQHTPPTALFVAEPPLFIAAMQHLTRKGIVAPERVSLICHDPSPAFSWCEPTISHISYDPQPCIHRVLEWVKNVAAGREDLRQTFSKSVFISGGTIGPVAARSGPRSH